MAPKDTSSKLVPINGESLLDDKQLIVRVLPDWGGPLTEQDYDGLTASWIPRELADQAMFRRISDKEGQEVIGQKGSRNCAGILIPYYFASEVRPHSYRIRRDNPEWIVGKGGKPKADRKYLGAPTSSNHIYFPPGITPGQLQDVSTPLILTEGEKKSLALRRLASYESPTLRFVPVALAGVWNWRGTVGKASGSKGDRVDVKGPIPDLDRVTWKDRIVFIIFDRNVNSNEGVMFARAALNRELTSRGAKVQFVHLPENCEVNGIDDFLAISGPNAALALFEAATPGKRLQVVKSPQFQSRPEGMFRVTAKGEQFVETQLSNFTAEIAKGIRLDDGVETKLEFEISCELMGRKSRFTIAATQFGGMEWPIEKLGPAAITYPNQRDYARTAIQSASLTAEEEHIYAHTGWRQIDGSWLYLHAGGAIGSHGSVPGINVRLPGALERYKMEEASTPEELGAAVRASLVLAELGPACVSFPVRAATCRAVLGESDFSVHIVGESGTFKSELAALEQQFFGPNLGSRNLPGSWSSTSNALEALCFHAKDALIVVDDFAPQGNPAEIARYHAAADRLFRGAGNGAGRMRLDSSARLRDAKPSRALILSTGEDVPRGHSVRARLLILELSKGAIDAGKLTQCQVAAKDGAYTRAMSGFLQWIAGRYEECQASFQAKRTIVRANVRLHAIHARTPEIVTNLQAGFETYLEFAEFCGVIDRLDRKRLATRSFDALIEAAKAQHQHQAPSEPAHRFLSLLQSCLSSGRAHLLSTTGAMPEISPADCGWRQNPAGNLSPAGTCIGWTDGAGIYIDPASAFGVANSMARDISEALTITEQTLRKRLSEKGLLASVDKCRETLTIRKKICGSIHGVLHFLRATILPDLEDGEDCDVG